MNVNRPITAIITAGALVAPAAAVAQTTDDPIATDGLLYAAADAAAAGLLENYGVTSTPAVLRMYDETDGRSAARAALMGPDVWIDRTYFAGVRARLAIENATTQISERASLCGLIAHEDGHRHGWTHPDQPIDGFQAGPPELMMSTGFRLVPAACNRWAIAETDRYAAPIRALRAARRAARSERRRARRAARQAAHHHRRTVR